MEAARRATEADVDRILQLAADAREALRGQRGGALWDATHPPLDATGLGTALDASDHAVVVGTVDGVVVGFGLAAWREVPGAGRLAAVADLVVEPAARAVGVGEAVLGALVAWATAAGCRGIDAPALPGDRTTKNFLEGQGFTARLLTLHRVLPS